MCMASFGSGVGRRPEGGACGGLATRGGGGASEEEDGGSSVADADRAFLLLVGVHVDSPATLSGLETSLRTGGCEQEELPNAVVISWSASSGYRDEVREGLETSLGARAAPVYALESEHQLSLFEHYRVLFETTRGCGDAQRVWVPGAGWFLFDGPEAYQRINLVRKRHTHGHGGRGAAVVRTLW